MGLESYLMIHEVFPQECSTDSWIGSQLYQGELKLSTLTLSCLQETLVTVGAGSCLWALACVLLHLTCSLLHTPVSTCRRCFCSRLCHIQLQKVEEVFSGVLTGLLVWQETLMTSCKTTLDGRPGWRRFRFLAWILACLTICFKLMVTMSKSNCYFYVIGVSLMLKSNSLWT